MHKLSHLLKEHRHKLRLSLRQAANMIGISHTYLEKLEKGVDSRTGICNNPTPDTLKLISIAYNIDYNELLMSCDYLLTFDITKFNVINNGICELISISERLTSNQIQHLISYARFLASDNLPHK